MDFQVNLELLLNLLFISVIVSTIIMALIQKIKTISFIKTDNQILLMNFFLSFLVGIPFCLTFYNLSLMHTLWVSIFAFIGAPSIYALLKKQNLINYTPKSLDDIENKLDSLTEDNK